MLENRVIVYIEDDPLSQEVMRMLLKDMNITQITIWGDCENFLERVEALLPRPDFFFLDIHVKPHTGFEMLTMLRNHAEFRKSTIVALTASVMSNEVQQLKIAGFDGIISKPIDPERFPTVLQMLMRGEKVWRIIG